MSSDLKVPSELQVSSKYHVPSEFQVSSDVQVPSISKIIVGVEHQFFNSAELLHYLKSHRFTRFEPT